ncbi:Metallo-beta-lactamase domain-containing protein OS=Streptomyces tendae OX=1932 GN=GUR47_01425 PE=4 SV=1 [Streptomyces tendae]
MTQQPRSTTSTSTSAEHTDTAPDHPPLARPRPPAERRVWPRTFHDRLTAPLPGLKALARFAREGAV